MPEHHCDPRLTEPPPPELRAGFGNTAVNTNRSCYGWRTARYTLCWRKPKRPGTYPFSSPSREQTPYLNYQCHHVWAWLGDKCRYLCQLFRARFQRGPRAACSMPAGVRLWPAAWPGLRTQPQHGRNTHNKYINVLPTQRTVCRFWGLIKQCYS